MRIAIDDFGIGHVSLDELARHPIERLKVAQALLARVASDPKHANVVRAAVRMGQELGITVVAEGVETEAQARLVMAAGLIKPRATTSAARSPSAPRPNYS